jgi:hypothetical protein
MGPARWLADRGYPPGAPPQTTQHPRIVLVRLRAETMTSAVTKWVSRRLCQARCRRQDGRRNGYKWRDEPQKETETQERR